MAPRLIREPDLQFVRDRFLTDNAAFQRTEDGRERIRPMQADIDVQAVGAGVEIVSVGALANTSKQTDLIIGSKRRLRYDGWR